MNKILEWFRAPRNLRWAKEELAELYESRAFFIAENQRLRIKLLEISEIIKEASSE